MAVLLDTLSWVMLVAGGAFVLIGGIGILRLPDLYTRMHAASLTDTNAQDTRRARAPRAAHLRILEEEGQKVPLGQQL